MCVGVFVRQKSKINNTSEISLIRNKLNRSQFPSRHETSHITSAKRKKKKGNLSQDVENLYRHYYSITKANLDFRSSLLFSLFLYFFLRSKQIIKSCSTFQVKVICFSYIIELICIRLLLSVWVCFLLVYFLALQIL